jgi:hypothetical protein
MTGAGCGQGSGAPRNQFAHDHDLQPAVPANINTAVRINSFFMTRISRPNLHFLSPELSSSQLYTTLHDVQTQPLLFHNMAAVLLRGVPRCTPAALERSVTNPRVLPTAVACHGRERP